MYMIRVGLKDRKFQVRKVVLKKKKKKKQNDMKIVEKVEVEKEKEELILD